MYTLYILECADGTLYTGITTDIARRLVEHNTSVRGAKYTRSRRPVMLRFTRRFRTRSRAAQEEARVKSLSRAEKLRLYTIYAPPHHEDGMVRGHESRG